jgi:two-component system OmpR family sensor kinase
MNRLFWKILGGVWLVLVITAVGSGYVVHSYHQSQSSHTAPDKFMTNMVATVIQHEGELGIKRLFAECSHSHCPPIFIFSDKGHEVMGRNVPPELQAQLAHQATQLSTAPDGHIYRIVDIGIPPDFLFRGPNFAPPPPEGISAPPRNDHPAPPSAMDIPPFPAIHIIIALLTSLLFSGAFAWYLTRPLLHLRKASRQLAEGILETRVLPFLGGRRDEIAELGKDFDYMATRLQSLVGAQTQLLHDVSHELRSPVTRMRLAIGLAQQQPEKFNAALERIEQEGERLDVLLGKILTLSRLDAGFHGGKSTFNLTELLVETVQDADFEARTSGKRVEFAANGDVFVSGYPDLIHRVLENVIRNGVKYTAGASTVTVSMHNENDQAHITVSDQGPGVPADELTDIFTPFFRSHSTSGKADGYGLGLAIAKRAIDVHGGNIVILNQSTGGLQVDISLPKTSAQ